MSTSNCGCLQNDKYYEVCSGIWIRGLFHSSSLPWTLLIGFHFVVCNRKEKLFGKQTVQDDAYAMEMGIWFAIQTDVK